MGGATAFFYGTLMHPKILMRVIGNDGSHLKSCPAILFDFTRHRVKYADYPGIIPYTKSETLLFNRKLEREERSVRGMLVAGLTQNDVALLDHFEGTEYSRGEVLVYPLEDFQDISAHSVDEETLPIPKNLRSPSPAQTYIYRDETGLQAKLWSYDDFVRENARKWY